MSTVTFYINSRDVDDENNEIILTLSAVIKHVMTSASESEISTMLFIFCNTVPLGKTLKELGYPHPLSPIAIDIFMSPVPFTNSIALKESKPTDIQFKWIKLHVTQTQFLYK